MKHAENCPDPKELAGAHATCPCMECMGTGITDAWGYMECSCGAELQSDKESRAKMRQLRKIGTLRLGQFKPLSGLPMQPVWLRQGEVRFRGNALVQYLLDHGGIDMNHLASVDFSIEDREQFAQLIGYSVDGFGELSYASDHVYDAARAEANRLLRKP